jgi:hypothetical protein
MNSKSFILATVFVFGFLPILALAASTPLVYKPLVGIPGIGTSSSFGEYINALYGLSIAIAALMAVIKIIIAGVKYMLSDVVTSKQEAIGDIKGSLLGLGVVISAVLVLTIINPQLTKTDLFIDKIIPVAVTATTSVSIPANIPGRSTISGGISVSASGYYYRESHPDPLFKQTCEDTGKIYAAVAGGRYEACYESLPASVKTDLETIFSSSSLNLPKIIERYQTAHRPRMITDITTLTNIAVGENSKNRNRSDVFLAVEFKDRSSETIPIYMDWIDASNASSITETCRNFQQALATSTIPVKIQTVGNLSKGYYACVRMP